MNVYWCNEKDDDCGLMVVARNRGIAKSIFMGEIDCNYIDVRCHILKRGICCYREGIIQTDDEITMNSLGLHYEETDDDF